VTAAFQAVREAELKPITHGHQGGMLRPKGLQRPKTPLAATVAACRAGLFRRERQPTLLRDSAATSLEAKGLV